VVNHLHFSWIPAAEFFFRNALFHLTHKAIFNKFIKIKLFLCRIKHQHAKRTRRKRFGSQCIKEGGDVVISKQLVPVELIANKIYLIRGHKVMLDRDLAALYGVETKVLKQAVKRNHKRFPDDFMFVLSQNEFETLRSQFVTSKTERRGGIQYAPMAFTEQGVAMQLPLRRYRGRGSG